MTGSLVCGNDRRTRDVQFKGETDHEEEYQIKSYQKIFDLLFFGRIDRPFYSREC